MDAFTKATWQARSLFTLRETDMYLRSEMHHEEVLSSIREDSLGGQVDL